MGGNKGYPFDDGEDQEGYVTVHAGEFHVGTLVGSEMFLYADCSAVPAGDFLADERVEHVLLEAHFRDAALASFRDGQVGFDWGYRGAVGAAVL